MFNPIIAPKAIGFFTSSEMSTSTHADVSHALRNKVLQSNGKPQTYLSVAELFEAVNETVRPYHCLYNFVDLYDDVSSAAHVTCHDHYLPEYMDNNEVIQRSIFQSHLDIPDVVCGHKIQISLPNIDRIEILQNLSGIFIVDAADYIKPISVIYFTDEISTRFTLGVLDISFEILLGLTY